jgi:ssDNA-binding Zn-finger/Zn-ribbon topoisomerase 1
MKAGFSNKGKCLECKDGIAMDRTNTSTGEMFLGCSNYPRCKNSSPYPQDFGGIEVPKAPKKKATKDTFPDGLPYEARLAKKRFRSR